MKTILLASLVISLFGSSFLAQAPTRAFEVATIKPHGPEPPHLVGGSCHGIDSTYPPGIGPALGRCVFTGATLSFLIGAVYPATVGVEVSQRIIGGAAWTEGEFWEVEGKAEDVPHVTRADLTEMLRTLLADRFKLQFHRETREVDGYRLVVAKGGPRITEDKSGDEIKPGMSGSPDGIMIRKNPLSSFVRMINAGAPVVDRTGLTGLYSFTFKQPSRQPVVSESGAEMPASIFTALQEQLGLKLEPQKLPQDVIIIDHAERPAPR